MAKRQTTGKTNDKKNLLEHVVRDIPGPAPGTKYVTLTVTDQQRTLHTLKLECGIILGRCIEPDGSTSTVSLGLGQPVHQLTMLTVAPELLPHMFDEVIKRIRPNAPPIPQKK